MAQAWRTAALVGQAFAGKLQPLEQLLGQLDASQERLTPAQQRTQAAMLAERLGQSMRPISDEAKRALLRLRES